jgi:glycosyltransferase involved in cell wall biosynthesis
MKSRPVRVLYFESGEYGGSVGQLAHLLEGLSARGFEVSFVSQFRTTGPADLFSVKGIAASYCLDVPPGTRPEIARHTLGLLHPTAFGVRFLAVSTWAILRGRPDVVCLNSGLENLIPALVAARLLHVPTVCHIRITAPFTRYERAFLPLVHLFVPVSKYGAEFARREGVPPARIRHIYDAFSLRQFDEQSGEQVAFAFQEDCVYLVQVGALSQRKRPALAIDAFEIAQAKCPTLRLILAGDGPLRSELQESIARRGLQEKVHLIGNCRQIPALLSRCQIGLLVSKDEGLPLCVLEYMAAGLPTVTSGLPMLSEAVEDGTTGLIATQDSPRNLADLLVALSESEELRRRFGAAGRARIEEGRFGPDRFWREMYDMLVRVAGREVVGAG